MKINNPQVTGILSGISLIFLCLMLLAKAPWPYVLGCGFVSGCVIAFIDYVLEKK